MTSVLTMALLALLFLIIALPGIAAVARPKAAVVAAPFYLLLLVGGLVYHVGLSSGGSMPAPRQSAEGPSGLCEQAVSQSMRGGLILDRANPTRVSVNRELWGQLPQQARDGLILCLQRIGPTGPAGQPVTIVEVEPA